MSPAPSSDGRRGRRGARRRAALVLAGRVGPVLHRDRHARADGRSRGRVYTQETNCTGGDNGLFGFAYHGFSGTTWYYICAVLLVVVAAGALVLVRSDFGLVMRAVRDNERRVRFFGTNVEAVKIGVFVLGAVLAALARRRLRDDRRLRLGASLRVPVLDADPDLGRGRRPRHDHRPGDRGDRPELRHLQAERVLPDRVGAFPRAPVRGGRRVRPGRRVPAARAACGRSACTAAGRRGSAARSCRAAGAARAPTARRADLRRLRARVRVRRARGAARRRLRDPGRRAALHRRPERRRQVDAAQRPHRRQAPGARARCLLRPPRRGGAERRADPQDRAGGDRAEVPDPAPLRQPHGRRDDPARVAERPDPVALAAHEADPGRALRARHRRRDRPRRPRGHRPRRRWRTA